MHFGSFTEEELQEINRRTILRLRAKQARLAAGPEHADAAAKMPSNPRVEMFGNSESAKFSESDIRNASIAAMKKLYGES